ncbi:MAG: hypothetical protein HZC22_13225 [Rhodocyclales bacterium]|nr:hypothetical protein [Rhodocyclales bacterium]
MDTTKKQYPINSGVLCLRDSLVAVATDIRDALLSLGAAPGTDYTHLDIMTLSMTFLCSKETADVRLIKEVSELAEFESDPIVEAIANEFIGINSASILEVATKVLHIAPHELTRDLQTRISIALGKLGWKKRRSWYGSTFVYVRPEQATPEAL